MSRWAIPVIALLMSIFFHIFILRIEWHNEKSDKPISINVSIQEYKEHEILKSEKKKTNKKNVLKKKTKVKNNLASKLINDTLASIQIQSEFESLFEYEKKWRNSVTLEIQSNSNNSIGQYTEINGNVHIQIAGSCFVYREPNPVWQFDESIFEFEECGSRFNLNNKL